MRVVVLAFVALIFSPFAFAQEDVAVDAAEPAPVAEAPAVVAEPEPAAPAVVVTPAAVVAPAVQAETKNDTSSAPVAAPTNAANTSGNPIPKKVSEEAAALKASNQRHDPENAEERDAQREEFLQERAERQKQMMDEAKAAAGKITASPPPAPAADPKPVVAAPAAVPAAAPAVAPVAAPAVAPQAEEVESE